MSRFKSVKSTLKAESPNPYAQRESVSWQHVLFFPYNLPGADSPSVFSTIWMAVLTLVGALLYGILFLLALNTQLAAPTSSSAFIVALVSGVFMIAPMMWTHERQLRIHTNPAIIMALVGTLDLGLFPALINVAIVLAGFALSGVAVAALGVTEVLVDVATGVSGYWMTWVATSVVAFVYIYNQKIEQKYESEIDNHSRATVWSGIWQFGFVLSLYGLGLRTYNTGLYLAAGIATSFTDQTPDGLAVDPAFYTLVPLLAASATAYLLYLAASFSIRLSNSDWPNRTGGYTQVPEDSGDIDAPVPGGYAMSSRARARKPQIDTTF